MDEKSKPPLHSPPPPTNPLSQWRGGGRGVTRAYEGTKIRVAIFFFPSLSLLSMNQLVVMVCTHARVCAHVCTLRGGHVHYLFISPVCQAATLCISACLAIIMPHALFNAHARAGSDADSYTSDLSRICSLITLSASRADCCKWLHQPFFHIHLRRLIIGSHTSPARLS